MVKYPHPESRILPWLKKARMISAIAMFTSAIWFVLAPSSSEGISITQFLTGCTFSGSLVATSLCEVFRRMIMGTTSVTEDAFFPMKKR
ncbi:hypothetical protein [Celeribacter halophilus]|uniref:hypothetical protein n=1 Tax=Celeribacter halophilus TaxID=576117 RepID=UPI001C0981A1|nr:hypothetical protein [Celeribacter halophilus]MBU2889109.1 hypothetical protein [Celeribacter halophilus]MDO6510364.1 hypothetical protein [Celeribacter halophilus]